MKGKLSLNIVNSSIILGHSDISNMEFVVAADKGPGPASAGLLGSLGRLDWGGAYALPGGNGGRDFGSMCQ